MRFFISINRLIHKMLGVDNLVDKVISVLILYISLKDLSCFQYIS
ncbi:hypothetical protein VCR3J2_280001 [Vibrio coralliirubri]|nr:hypothetical protein VCR15J2_520001 [Vibrio coralliirubri]CDT83403.1 hypothetical protein VCR3J2_280001 [Vibrio coralliirubri]CDT89488.1 hypothetical protein VCR29J2_730039 [Vibrio coralliirubri]CDU07078.1 hypothetical protein VCR12J2_970001 [Vibrio coralliirubri]